MAQPPRKGLVTQETLLAAKLGFSAHENFDASSDEEEEEEAAPALRGGALDARRGGGGGGGGSAGRAGPPD